MIENIDKFIEQENKPKKIKKKKCSICHEIKPITEFSNNGKFHLRVYCKKCQKGIANQYYQKIKIRNKDKVPYNNTFKRCPKCGKLKKRTKENWNKQDIRKDGLRSYCKKCVKEKNIKSKFNLTIEQYNNILMKQKNKCKICGNKFGDKFKKACIDHNHKTGEVRALLCKSCNIGLGYFKDNSFILFKAIKYLEEYK